MKYKEIIEPYIAKLKETTPKERLSGIKSLFIELKNAGFKKADMSDGVLDLIDKVATDTRLPVGKQVKLRMELSNLFLLVFSILEKGKAPVAEKPKKVVKDEEAFDESNDDEINEKLSKLRPEDFKKKETDWEFMESVGMVRVDDPDVGEPHE